MNTIPSESQRLADAVGNIAATMVEIIDARLKLTSSVIQQYLAFKAMEPLITQKQTVEHFHVNLRTIDNWIAKNYVPH